MAEDPVKEAVQNLVRLERIANSLSGEARQRIYDLLNEIVAELARLNPMGAARVDTQTRRLRRLIERIEDLTDDAYDAWFRQLREDLARVGWEQAQFAQGQIRDIIGPGVVSVELDRGRVGINAMKAILDRDPFEGDLLRDWAESAGDATVRRVRREIQRGMVEGITLDEMVERVRGREMPNGGFTGGVLNATARDTEAIVRTGVNFIANRGTRDTYEGNRDILLGYEIVATLDARTTVICASKDGDVWAFDDPDAELPPFHFGCRTVTASLIDWDGIGIEPPEDGRRPARRYRLEDGKLVLEGSSRVPTSQKYVEWFRDLPNAVQDEIIGPERARLFREGKITFKQMISDDNELIPLEQLRGSA